MTHGHIHLFYSTLEGYSKYTYLDDYPLQQRVSGAVQRGQHQPPATYLEPGEPYTHRKT